MILKYINNKASQYKSVLWENKQSSLHFRAVLFVAQLVFVVLRDIFNGKLKLWAASLSYTSLLTITPTLAIVFAFLKTMGVHKQAEPFLIELLHPLGEKGIEFGVKAINYIESIDVGVLGIVGSLLLFYLATSLIQQIETASNAIWRVKSDRNIMSRLFVYTLFITIAPLLFFSAIAITATIMNTELVQAILQFEGIPTLLYLFNRFVPYVFVIVALTITYYFIPNTKVNIKNALIGGVVAGSIWESIGWVFTKFVVSSTNYEAIYSSFAIIVLFLIWLNISWLIFLSGASITFYTQNRECITEHP